jgi:hypothetical protein
MRDSVALSQGRRLTILLIEIVVLSVASKIALGTFLPPNGNQGFWFYTGLLGLIFGSRLDTPFFAKPADVILYAAPAAVALALANDWTVWDSGRKVAFVIAVFYCAAVAIIGGIAILTKDSPREPVQRASNVARVLGEVLGAPRIIYTVVVVFAIYAFHSGSAREVGVLALAWMLTAILSPLEGSVRLFDRMKAILAGAQRPGVAGEVAAYQTPGLVLIRRTPNSTISTGGLLAAKDPLGPRVLIALDHVGRDAGLLLRTLDTECVPVPAGVTALLRGLPDGTCVPLDAADATIAANGLVKQRDALVGVVAPDTALDRLYFEVVRGEGLQEGRLVETPVNGTAVTYQVVNGLTKDEVVQQKNTFGFVRAQAQKIGVWDGETGRFTPSAWLPRPNAPVSLKPAAPFQVRPDAVGHFPGTDYPVTLRTDNGVSVGLNALVTHNTAILGILGIGKSYLALELVERMAAAGIKVLCLDLTNQYAVELVPYHDAADNDARVTALKQAGANGKTNVQKNVEDGGSVTTFADSVRQHLEEFMSSGYAGKILVLNPAQFEVWRQDSKPYQNQASMASLTPAEITQVVSDAALQVVSAAGMTDEARLCIVYEEAHSLVPEWNSAVAEGDRAAANGTARAILQGRKYGLGCLLITQRTANVTKTILNQCNSVFAMRTFDDTGKDFLANYLGREYAQVLPSLSERHAVFFGRASQCENPVLMRANDREAFLAAFRTSPQAAQPDVQ